MVHANCFRHSPSDYLPVNLIHNSRPTEIHSESPEIQGVQMIGKRNSLVTAILVTGALAFPQIAQAATPPQYVIPVSAGADISVVATTGDYISGQILRGTPDGMGVLKNADGSLTLLSNHEITTTPAVMAASGSTTSPWSSSISKLAYDVKTNTFTKDENLIKNIKFYDYTTRTWVSTPDHSLPAGSPTTNAYGDYMGGWGLSRFCSSNLVQAGGLAYTETVKGKKVTYGYTGAVYFTGEENGDLSRSFASDMDGNLIQLPSFGLFGAENWLTAPKTGKTTVVMGNEDNGAATSQLYMYVGTKQATGANFAEKAGLTNGKLYTLAVENFLTDNAFRTAKKTREAVPVSFNEINTDPRFGNFANMAQANGTTFARIEDGEWDPKNSNVYYFQTTESNKEAAATVADPSDPAGTTRDGGALWRLTFKDAANPLLGGTLEMLLNGTEPLLLNKPDNLAVDEAGYIILQEDSGNNNHVGRVVVYRLSDGKMAVLAQFDPKYFAKDGSNFMTIDEETSGVINVNQFLKKAGDTKSYFFFNAQVHTPTVQASRPDIVASPEEWKKINDAGVEGGQYYKLVIDWSKVNFS